MRVEVWDDCGPDTKPLFLGAALVDGPVDPCTPLRLPPATPTTHSSATSVSTAASARPDPPPPSHVAGPAPADPVTVPLCVDGVPVGAMDVRVWVGGRGDDGVRDAVALRSPRSPLFGAVTSEIDAARRALKDGLAAGLPPIDGPGSPRVHLCSPVRPLCAFLCVHLWACVPVCFPVFICVRVCVPVFTCVRV